MLSLFIIFSISKEVVENPPISFEKGTISSSFYSKTSTDTSEIQSFFQSLGCLSSNVITRTINKMKFSSKSSTIEHNFEMKINPSNTTQRTAVRTAVLVSFIKSGSEINCRVYYAQLKLPVNSQVITTTSSTFLWFEWGKEVTITWRPLTTSELNQINSKCDSLMASKINEIKTWAF